MDQGASSEGRDAVSQAEDAVVVTDKLGDDHDSIYSSADSGPAYQRPQSTHSTSDISMLADTDDEDSYEALQTGVSAGANPSAIDSSMSTNGGLLGKRKSPDESVEGSENTAGSRTDHNKKVKRDHNVADEVETSDKSQLPAEIWHHIFTFCPPRSLGRLLLVNKLFHSYLDPSSAPPANSSTSAPSGALSRLGANAIWQASRRLFWPNMPAPLLGKTELEMWRLACSPCCLHCGKHSARRNDGSGNDQLPGPGENGISIIWPFATRACGDCLKSKSMKELDILLSSSIPSDLLSGLPVVFVTEGMDAFSARALENDRIPVNTKVTKRFWADDVESLKQEFLEVRALGAAAVEEWLKGLEGRGSQRRNDCLRWEKFAESPSMLQMQTLLHPGYISQSLPSLPPSANKLSKAHLAGNEAHPEVTSSNQPHPLPPPPHRPERTKEEVAELKAARKAEIERRAALLNPPIKPSVLVHIPSFQAAIQLITPLDDNAWEVLRPRLLAQQADAELREQKQAAQSRSNESAEQQRGREEILKEKEILDKDWEVVQEPLRRRIALLADEVIRDAWGGGEKVTKENSPKFAVDVLLYVRRNFYAEVAKEAAAAQAAGNEPQTDPVQGPFTQKLTLENMKWIFDTKIRPRTESYRKELFLCNGCENNPKFYGFEGVIQHYAAKHTTALSSGNIVVHWRAEWPEHSPFSTEPQNANRKQHLQQQPQAFAAPHLISQQPYNQAAYQPGIPPGGLPAQPFPGGSVQFSAPPYTDSYPPQPYHPQGSYQPPATGYTPSPFPGQEAPYPYQPSYQHAAPDASHPYAPVSSNGVPVVHPQASQYSYDPFQPHPQMDPRVPQGGHYADQYRFRLDAMARDARELWTTTSQIKDMPGNVRVHIVMHHLSKRFRSKFNESPPLAMFIDGLSNNKDMRPVRNVNELKCKVCHLGLGNSYATEQDKRSFSLPQLVNHFQAKHVEALMDTPAYSPVLDWTVDMVLLPDAQVLQRVIRSTGTDSQKSYLVSEALSHLIGQPQNAASWPALQEAGDTQMPSVDNHDRYYASTSHPPTISYSSQDQPLQPEISYEPPASQPHVPSYPYAQRQAPDFGSITEAAKALQHQSSAQPLAQAVSMGKHGDSGRTSTQSRNPNTQHGRQGGSKKNKKNRKKQRNGSEEAELARRKELEEQEEKQAEEEERRQEEEIRAMWAADRAQAARAQPPAAAAPPKVPEDVVVQTPAYTSNTTSRSKTPSVVVSKPRSPQVRAEPRPVRRQEYVAAQEESDLLGALEMHLDEEPRREIREIQHHRPSNVIYIDDREELPIPRERRRSPEMPIRYVDEHPAPPRGRSPSPVYIRYTRQPPVEGCEERSPGPPVEPFYRIREPAPVQESLHYERRAPPQEYYHVYADEVRTRPVEYETYELVQVRHPDGDYVVRRPVRTIIPEPEPEFERVPARYYARYEDEVEATRPVVRREMSAYPPHHRYEQQVVYAREPGGGPQPPVVYETRPPAAPPRADQISRADPEYYEEYDPHFPAAQTQTQTQTHAAGSVVRRQVRYE